MRQPPNQQSAHRATKTLANLAAIIVTLVLVVLLTPSCSRQEDTNQSATPRLVVAINAGVEGRAIAELSKKYPDALIETVELPYTNLREKLQQILISNRHTYDLVMIDDPWFPEFADHLAELDQIPDKLLTDIIPASLHLAKHPYEVGKLKALPFVGNCQLLFYRKDLLQQVDTAAPPENWPALVNLATKISSNTEAAGYCIRGKSGAPIVTDFLPVLWSMGGSIFADRGQPTTVTIDSIETRDALTLYYDLAKLSPSGAEAYDWTEMTAAFTAGTAAMQLNWPAAVATVDAEIPRNQKGDRQWGVAIPPGGPGAPTGTSMAGNWLLGVPTSSNQKQETQQYLVWLMERQTEAAAMGNPPTRISVYETLQTDPAYFHFSTLRQALEQSTPRPRTPRWNAVEDVISQAVSGVITGRTEVEEAIPLMADGISTAISDQ